MVSLLFLSGGLANYSSLDCRCCTCNQHTFPLLTTGRGCLAWTFFRTRVTDCTPFLWRCPFEVTGVVPEVRESLPWYQMQTIWRVPLSLNVWTEAQTGWGSQPKLNKVSETSSESAGNLGSERTYSRTSGAAGKTTELKGLIGFGKASGEELGYHFRSHHCQHLMSSEVHCHQFSATRTP